MIEFLIDIVIFVCTSWALFMGMLFYKLTDANWYHQFVTQDFKDKDYFTRMVNFLLN